MKLIMKDVLIFLKQKQNLKQEEDLEYYTIKLGFYLMNSLNF